MSETWDDLTQTPLYDEHLMLGARYDTIEDWLLAAPRSYGELDEELTAVQEGCALCDLTGMAMLLISGSGAEGFVHAAFAGSLLAVGECHFCAVVTGDGTVASIPLLARTGDNEYLVFDPTARGMVLAAWLNFLVGIEQNGYKPFAGVEVEDVSSSLVPLLLWGPHEPAILGDYVARMTDLPTSGQIRSPKLDRISCLVASPPLGKEPCSLVLVPPAYARVLWRSFLSFPVVTPIGSSALVRMARPHAPWLDAVLAEERIELALSELLSHGLVRPEGGYVGARGLAE